MAWFNNDGLDIRFGVERATPSPGGELTAYGPLRLVSFELDYTDFAATPARVSNTVFLPAYSYVERVRVTTETAFDSAGDAFVYNLGLQRYDQSTEIDYNGLIAAQPQADVNAAGEIQEVIVGHTYAGALIGVSSGANPGYITVDYDTAAPTAGKARWEVYYRYNPA